MTREPEYDDRDRALLLADLERELIPRGSHGVPIAEATDPNNNPYLPGASGRFVAVPRADYAQAALDRATEARRKAAGDADWPLQWSVVLQKADNAE